MAKGIVTKDTAKDERCRLATCPAYGTRNPDCAKCTGPVVWKDRQGRSHGRPRSCHACPMNGLNLPVCWHSCPGPNPNFQCDGKDIVTAGSLEDPEAFLAQNALETGAFDRNGDSVIDAIPSEEDEPSKPFASDSAAATAPIDPEAARRAYDGSVTDSLSCEAETACKVVFSTVMGLDETDLRIFYHLYRGVEPFRIAEKIGISRQAVFRRKERMARDNRWMRRFVKALGLKASGGGGANRGKCRNAPVFQPDLFETALMESLRDDTRRRRLND